MAEDPKVFEAEFDSAGVLSIRVTRYPQDRRPFEKPNPNDFPEDLRHAIRVWLAGNQP